MKKHNTAWLVVGVLAASLILLALLSFFYPKEGITIRGTTYRFASIDDLKSRWTFLDFDNSADSIALVMAQAARRDSLYRAMQDSLNEQFAAKEEVFIKYFTESASHLYFPVVEYRVPVDSNGVLDTLSVQTAGWRDTVLYSYFDDFYASLDNASAEPVRVVHYGDSQIEEDRLSNNLRECLQGRFGGGGVGLLPYRHTFYNLTVSEQLTGTTTHYSLISYYADAQRKSSNYGPLMQATGINGDTKMSIFPRKNTPLTTSHYFNTMKVLTGSEPLKLIVGDTAITTKASELAITTVNLPDSTRQIQFRIVGRGDVYGVSLQNTTGVTVDNVALRGCSGTIFRQVSKQQLSDYFAATNTRLIILEFGGNAIPSISSQKSVDSYIGRLLANADYLHSIAPTAKILFVGPSDMVTSHGGVRTTYKYLPYFDRHAREVFTRAGYAYWSMFDTMGGSESMIRWVKATPQLAASDHVHFTRAGAKIIGDALADAIIQGYEYYKLRQSQLSQPADSISSDSVMLDSLTIGEETE